MFLDVSDLEVHYAGRPQPAVDGVSFGLAPGDIGVLIGPSGCGKTTLLRAVAGLEQAQAGSITLAQQLVSSPSLQVPAESRRIGMVFQDYALFPHLDVGRNVGFGLPHLSGKAREARVAEVLALVGLGQAQRRFPHELSGGQQQRVALARALAPQPRLLLLDEPFSNLDVELRERLAHEVRGILKAAGATALFVTHDQLEAFAIGDRIGVMHQGRLHQWDDAHTLYHRPATRLVADFIGHGVFVRADIRRDGAQAVLKTALGDIACDAGALPAPDAAACDLLLRADDVVADATSAIQGRLARKAFRGSMFLYTLTLANGETALAHVPSGERHEVGDMIGLRPAVRQVVAFEPNASGVAVA